MKSFLSTLSSFKYPILVLVGGIVLGGMVGGMSQALVVAVLVVLEISLSFDNAVINATILRRMNACWHDDALSIRIMPCNSSPTVSSDRA